MKNETPITEAELAEFEENAQVIKPRNVLRLIAEVRRLNGLVETACCVGALYVGRDGEFYSRTNEFGDTNYKVEDCPGLVPFLDPAYAPYQAPPPEPPPPVTKFLLQSGGRIIGKIIEPPDAPAELKRQEGGEG